MTEEEKDKLWAETKELERQRYEKRRKYFAENPEAALAEQREILYDPLCQRMNDRLFDDDIDFIECTVVGISQNCGERFQDVMSHLHEDSLLLLLPEPENKHDKNAIAVYDSEGKIGYVAAKETASIRSSLCEFGYTECYVMRKYKNSLLVQLEYVSEEENKSYHDENPYMEREDGPTPNGGAYSVAYYYDEEGNPCQKINAKKIHIVEYTKYGERIMESNGFMGKSGPMFDEFTEKMHSEFTVDEETEKQLRAGCVWTLLDSDSPKEDVEHWAKRYGIDYDIAMKWKNLSLNLKAQSPKNKKPKKYVVPEKEEMDSDLIAIKLWKGEREPQSEWERKVKKEFDDMRRQGKIPDFSWFD